MSPFNLFVTVSVYFGVTLLKVGQMEIKKSTALIDDAAIDDRRGLVDDRRSSPRRKALRGAQIFWSTALPFFGPLALPFGASFAIVRKRGPR